MMEDEQNKFVMKRFVHALMIGYESVLGKLDMDELLRTAHLEQYIDNYPENELDKSIPYGHIAVLRTALTTKYGGRGGQVLALRIGKKMFPTLLKSLGIRVAGLEFLALPLNTRIKSSFAPLVHMFTTFLSQDFSVTETDTHYIFSTKQCPFCMDQKVDRPLCQVQIGLLGEWFTWISNGYVWVDGRQQYISYTFELKIESCLATGNNEGIILFYKEPVSNSTE